MTGDSVDHAFTALPVTQRDFLTALLGDGEQSGYVELRVLRLKGGLERRLWIDVRDGHLLTVPSVPRHRAVYYGVALRIRRGDARGVGSLQNCHQTDIIYADLDLKTVSSVESSDDAVLTMSAADVRAHATQLAHAAMARCTEVGLPPLACVYTGHGVQIVWRLSRPVLLSITVAYNKALVGIFGVGYGHDTRAHDASRVLRLIGTENVKNPARPLPVETWMFMPEARVGVEALDDVLRRFPTGTAGDQKPVTRRGPDVIAEFNRRFPIRQLLEKYGYVRQGEDRYTRPGDGASGGDVHLLHDTRGILCSYHHSDNDPLVGTPGDGHCRDPFALFRDREHAGNARAAVRAAAVSLGMDQTGGRDPEAVAGVVGGNDSQESKKKKPPAATLAVRLVLEAGAEHWRDSAGHTYLTVEIGDHLEHYRLPSNGAADYMRNLYYSTEKASLTSQALHEATALLCTLGRLEGKTHLVGLRVLHTQGRTYVDLGDPMWRVVEVTSDGWRCISSQESPVRFVRSQGMLPLPTPEQGGTLSDLRRFVNVDDAAFLLCVSWLLGALSGIPPFPLLALGGEEGSGKSTIASVLKHIVDPHWADRRRPPRSEHDLFIAAQSSRILILDNLSAIPEWLSDALCTIATRGTFATRTLYTDGEETLLQAQRSVIINGIPDLLARPDLAERALTVTLRRIPSTERRPEAELWQALEAARPLLLGALLDALSVALRRLPETSLTHAPRLADFARLVVAGESALPWAAGDFLKTYGRMQTDAAMLLLDDEPVAEVLRQFLDETGQWSGTVKDLLQSLNDLLPLSSRPPQNWPTTPKALGSQIRRLSAALAKSGYHVTHLRRSNKGEVYELSKAVVETSTTSEDD